MALRLRWHRLRAVILAAAVEIVRVVPRRGRPGDGASGFRSFALQDRATPAAPVAIRGTSFPSCSSAIAGTPRFGIVGISGGRVDTDNPCAQAEAAHFANVSLSVNTGLNTAGAYSAQAMDEGSCHGDLRCGAYWYGFLAAVHAYNFATREHLQGTRTWWLDVEVMNTWNRDTALNDASILGEHQGLALMTAGAKHRPTIGVYARPGEWATITGGGLASHHWPAWYATGLRKQTTAQLQRDCAAGRSFTAGPVQVVQWIGPGRLDDLDHGC